MDMGADVRHATHSAVPSGLMRFQISVPNVETLGYYRPSLRDGEWQILAIGQPCPRIHEMAKNARTPARWCSASAALLDPQFLSIASSISFMSFSCVLKSSFNAA